MRSEGRTKGGQATSSYKHCFALFAALNFQLNLSCSHRPYGHILYSLMR